MNKSVLLAPVIGAALVGGIVNMSWSGQGVKPERIIDTYADIAHAAYSDSLSTARELDDALNRLVSKPNDKTLAAAKSAWVAARAPYQQTEVYRFGNAIVDDWDGKVNAWPLDEGLIDYVDASYGEESDENALYTANIIANPKMMLGGKEIDATNITPALLSETLHEVDEVEVNVATGYHAIEFLLWGQDLNGNGAVVGNRAASDFDTQNCSGGHCQRRVDYLRAASRLLISDLEWMVAQWVDDGDARKALTGQSTDASLATILIGMGSLSYGELAGERMKLGLILHNPEEEHDCFSDNTHYSHFYDALGVRNVYTGTYKRVDGSVVKGPSLSDLVAEKNSAADNALRKSLDATVSKMQVLVDSAKAGESYDQLIAEGNASGNAKVQAAIDALLDQTRDIETIVSALSLDNIDFEGSDSLDNPSAIQ